MNKVGDHTHVVPRLPCWSKDDGSRTAMAPYDMWVKFAGDNRGQIYFRKRTGLRRIFLPSELTYESKSVPGRESHWALR